MQLIGREQYFTLHVLGDGSDGALADGQTAAGLGQPGLKLVTALPSLPGKLRHGAPPYLAFSPFGQTKSSWRQELSHV